MDNTTTGGIVSRKLLTLIAGAVVFAASLVIVPLAAAGGDRNRDRIPDRWEKRHHLSLAHNQAKRDQDHDGLNNMGEFQANLDPRDDDSDDDGIEDGDENAGKITSFQNGVLTITLAGGGSLTATVAGDTEVECDDDAKASTSTRDHGGDDSDDEHENGDHEDGDREDGDDDNRGDDGNCGTEALTVNRTVKEAELKTQGGTAVWKQLELGAA